MTSARPTSRPLLLAFEAAACLGLLGAAIFEKTREGVQLELLLVAFATGVLHVKRLLALRGDEPPRAVPSLLEVAAIAGAFTATAAPPWAVSAAVLAGLLGSRAGDSHAASDERGAPWLRALGAGAVLVALLALVHRVGHPPGYALLWQHKSALVGVALVPVLLEALLGEKTTAAALARLAGGAALAAAASRANGPGDLLLALVAALRAVVALSVARVPQAERERAQVRAALRVGTMLGVLGLVWLVGEAAFRFVPNKYREIAPPPLDTFHVPGATYVYEGMLLGPKQPKPVVTVWNRGGWHDVDHAPARAPGVARVLVLGDSFVEGVQVELEALYHRRLERALAARGASVEALALAMSGWGQVQELSVLEREGLGYDPDVVIVEFLPSNDVRNDEDGLEQLARDETIESSFARPVFVAAMGARLYFTAFVMDHLDLVVRSAKGRRDPIDADVYREPARQRPDLWAHAWTRVEELTKAMEALLRARGARLLVVVFPTTHELGAAPSPDMEMARPARRMLEICARHGVAALDLTPAFARIPSEERAGLFVPGDGHWSPRGHDLAAEETARFLERSGLLEAARARARAAK